MAGLPEKRPLPLDPKYDHYDYPTEAPTPQNGHPGYTTPEQEAQVSQLRLMLEAEGITDGLDTLCLVCEISIRRNARALGADEDIAPILKGTKV